MFFCSFLHQFLTIYTLQLHLAALLFLIKVKSVGAGVKLILLRPLISMTSKLPEVCESELTLLHTHCLKLERHWNSSVGVDMNNWLTEGKRRSRRKALAERKNFLLQVCFEREQWVVSSSQNVLCYCWFFVCRRQKVTSWLRLFFPRLLCTLKAYPSDPTLPSFNSWDWASHFFHFRWSATKG